MTYSLVSAGTVASVAGGASVAATCTSTTAHNLLVLGFGGQAFSGMTVSLPAGWVRAATVLSGTFHQSDVWYYPDCPAGITAATVTLNGATTAAAQIFEFHDSAGTNTSPLDVTGTVNNDVATPVAVATSGAVAAAGELAFSANGGLYGSATKDTLVQGAGFTHGGNYGDALKQTVHEGFDYQASAASGTVTDSVTFTGPFSNFTGVIATFKVYTPGAAFDKAGTPATGTTALTVVVPAAAAIGSVMVMTVLASTATAPNAATATATGWTQRDIATDTGGSPCPTITTLWRACQAGDPGASVSVSFGSAPSTTAGVINTYTGADPAAPFEASLASFDATGGAATHTAGPITTTKDTDLILAAFGDRSGSTWTPPGGYTERSDTTSGAVSSLETIDSNGPVAHGSISVVGTGSVSTGTAVMWIGALQVPSAAPAAIPDVAMAPMTGG